MERESKSEVGSFVYLGWTSGANISFQPDGSKALRVSKVAGEQPYP